MEGWRFGDTELSLGSSVAVASLRADISGRLEALTRVGEHLSRASGRALVLLILRAETPAPDAELRRRARAILAPLLEHARAVAVVVEGAGIVATTKRTMVRVVATVVRGRAEFSVFGDVAAAHAWLNARAQNASPQASELQGAIAGLSSIEFHPKTG